MKHFSGLVAVLLSCVTLDDGSAGKCSAERFPKHRFITSNPDVEDMWPCFSPDSRTLLFSRTTDRKTWRLFTVSIDGGQPAPFPEGFSVRGTRASWSRQNLVAFNGQPSTGRFNVSVSDGNGSGLRVLDAAGLTDQMSYPSWYPDGKSVAVVDFAGDQGSAIKKVDIETGRVVALTDPKTHWAGVPRVSPDGSQIVMGGQVRRGQRYSQYRNQIWFLNRKGELRALDSMRGWAPFWSPDGQWIVFASDRGSDKDQSAIFIASPDGAAIQQLTPADLNAGHPTWSPDGKQIAFFSQLSVDTKARGLALVEADAALALVRSHTEQSALDQFFRPPLEFANDFGDYRSPLTFNDGLPVETTDDWRRQEIAGSGYRRKAIWSSSSAFRMQGPQGSFAGSFDDKAETSGCDTFLRGGRIPCGARSRPTSVPAHRAATTGRTGRLVRLPLR